jgi:hypothetical protein
MAQGRARSSRRRRRRRRRRSPPTAATSPLLPPTTAGPSEWTSLRRCTQVREAVQGNAMRQHRLAGNRPWLQEFGHLRAAALFPASHCSVQWRTPIDGWHARTQALLNPRRPPARVPCSQAGLQGGGAAARAVGRLRVPAQDKAHRAHQGGAAGARQAAVCAAGAGADLEGVYGC